MKIVILGSGTSTGVPVLGCQCSVCLSDSKYNKRTRSSIAIATDSVGWIVVDTAPEFRLQALDAGIHRVEVVLYTHLHADHCAGFDDLRAFSFGDEHSIDCFMAPEFMEEFKDRFGYVFRDTGYMGAKPKIELKEIIPAGFVVHGLKIEPIRLPHGHLKTVAYRIGNFLYATDFKSFSSSQIKKLSGKIDTMIASGIHFGEHAAHSTIPETIELFQKLEVKQGIITHLSHEVDYLRDNSRLPDNVFLAYDGMVITTNT